MRVWRTHIDGGQAAEYEHFAATESLPMFRAQPGFLGLLFGRDGDKCIVTTLWKDHAAADALENSPAYQDTVARISRFLVGESTVERFEAHSADLPTDS
jgi:quinol monooxygenase YgiN